jgi:hypothetical protein
MKLHALSIVCVLLAMAAGWILILGVRPASAVDPPRAAAPEAGRYQILQDKNRQPEYLFDPATGQMWRASFVATEKGEWVEHIAPLKKK